MSNCLITLMFYENTNQINQNSIIFLHQKDIAFSVYSMFSINWPKAHCFLPSCNTAFVHRELKEVDGHDHF